MYGNLGDATTGGSEAGGCPACDPGNVNIAGSNCDLDCSGTSAPPASCDANLSAAGPASDFAKALGICQLAGGGKWGLISATYTQGYNSTTPPAAGQHAISPSFGSTLTPREGKSLGVMSSGYAYNCDDPSQTATCAGMNGSGDPYFKGGVPMTGPGTSPPGYPKSTTSCPVAKNVNDVSGITLQVLVPKNAQGFSFDFDFFSGEWPDYVCTQFNDSFVGWLNSAAWNGLNNDGDLNTSFDMMGNPINVNNAFFSHCTPGTMLGCNGLAGGGGTSTCSGGPAELQGTGFYNLGNWCGSQSTGGGSTGWLTTKAPVKGAEVITLQFIVWDTGDQAYDSSVLLDNLTWYGTTPMAGTAPSQPIQ